MQFQGFKPEAQKRIAGKLGYTGDMSNFDGYLEQNPEAKQQMDTYNQQAVKMMQGGMVRKNFAAGGFTYADSYDPATGRLGQGNTYGAMADGSQLIKSLVGGGKAEYRILDPSGTSVTNTFDNFDDALKFADPSTGTSQGSTRSGRSDRNARDIIKQGPNNLPGGVDREGGPSGFSPEDLVRDPVQMPMPTGGGTNSGRTGGSVQGSTSYTPVGIYGQAEVQDGTRQLTRNRSVPSTSTATSIGDISAERVTTPELPQGTAVDAVGVDIQQDQSIDSTAGTVTGDITTGVQQASASQATAAPTTDANLIDDVSKVAGADLDTALDKTTPAVGTVDPRANVTAQIDRTTDVSKLTGAETTGILMDDPTQRVFGDQEEVKATANADSAAKFTEQVQAATATPTQKATVKGQLAELMTDFDDGETPAWAAGALRAATSAMSARGLGASSMAGQAIVQAAMEAALPIASADATTFAQFESQNLSNRQQRAMLAAEQRANFMGQEFDQQFQARVMNASKVSDIANMNFTAEQQVALENSRIANTVNLANLSNEQAVIMAEAAALSNLEMASLSNRQQAEVVNSQNLMQMDMANLSNAQQANMFKGQQRTAAIFSDAAAENAAAQFNASSENQTDQFFANLKTQNSQFNTSQTNAINQFNAGETNAQSRFVSEMMNQREQFNAQNKLVVEQSNAVWRREVATADTQAINRTNELNASALLDVSNTAYNNMWQYYADTMEFAFTSANDERDRMTEMAIAKLQVDSNFDIAKWQADAASSAAIGNALMKIATTDFSGDTLLEKGWDWISG